MSTGIPKVESASVDTPTHKNTNVLGSILVRLLWLPGLLMRMFQKKEAKVNLDAELKLYSEMFPSGFLHYGYFTDPDVDPRFISFGDLDQAQTNYANNLVELITDQEGTVLDVGCGTGGISEMLVNRGTPAIALTPDKHQISYIKQFRPNITSIQSTFEDFDESPYQGKIGTVLTSESLQYLDLEVSLPKIKRLLKPGGKWVACDYFCLTEEKTSGHHFELFRKALAEHGFRISYEKDITPNILPTLKFALIFSDRFVIPLFNFTKDKLKTKKPGIHYIFESLFDYVDAKIARSYATIQPEVFASKKQYVTLVMELEDN